MEVLLCQGMVFLIINGLLFRKGKDFLLGRGFFLCKGQKGKCSGKGRAPFENDSVLGKVNESYSNVPFRKGKISLVEMVISENICRPQYRETLS